MLDITQAHVVPACAMSVTRDSEMGPLHARARPYSCDCFYDNVTTGVVLPIARDGKRCEVCAGSQDCTDPTRPTCNYGFCEPG